MFLRELTEINAGSGDEARLREFIIEKIKDKVDNYEVDRQGNLIAFKSGKVKGFRIGLLAHMDEVSFMITSINDDGTLSFRPVGGVDPKVVVGKTLVINESIGVVGYKPIHLQKDDDGKISYDNLKIFIGKTKKDDVKIKLGSYAYFNTKYEETNGFAISKALDDRVGCSLEIKLIHECQNLFDTYYIFTVGEEIGGLGSSVIMEEIPLDVALILEGTTTGDLPELEKSRWASNLGGGPVITFFHSGYVIDERVFKAITETAERENIPYQLKRRTAGSTDARLIATRAVGAPSGVISVPCRYIHSPVSVMKLSDYENTYKLVKSLLETTTLRDFIKGEKND